MARTTDIADLFQLARRCKPLGNGHHAGWFRAFSGSMEFHKALRLRRASGEVGTEWSM